MNALLISVALTFWVGSVLAEPPAGPDVTHVIPGSHAKYGVNNFKMVIPGVLYRGGGTGPQAPLTSAPLQALCADGFVAAVYAYGKGWQGGPRSVSCGAGQLTYVSKRWDHPDEQHEIMKRLHSIIQEGHGAMYVHCWYGIHASGYIAATALKQFCGLSDERAVAYWNSNVPQKIQYPAVRAKVRGFKPFPELQITAEQQARVCPKKGL